MKRIPPGWTQTRLLTMAAEIQRAFEPLHQATMAYAAHHSPETLQTYRDELDRFYTHPFQDFYSFEAPEFLSRIKAGDPEALENAILFLENDPYCFRSGYIKQKLCDALKKPHLTESQKKHLRVSVLRMVYAEHRRLEFRNFVRLASKLDSAEFLKQVESLDTSGNAVAEKRKQYLLAHLSPESGARK